MTACSSWPITSILMGERKTDTALVRFDCACGVHEELTICDSSIHPPLRFTAALRALHARGEWPKPDLELGDAVAAGWPAPKHEMETA